MNITTNKIIKPALKCFIIVLLGNALLLAGCKKFLDQKPQQSLFVPTNLDDLQQLLNNARYAINTAGVGSLAEMIADNYYVISSDWQTWLQAYPAMALNYNWDQAALPYSETWTAAYQGPIYYSNIVLDQLPKITIKAGEEAKRDVIKGSSLFYRAFSYLGLAQIYCKPYSSANAGSPGLILKNTASVTEKVTRATVQQTYDRIIIDLKDAAALLPNTVIYPTRPTKTAAYAALARTYLFMRDYANAAQYANLALQQKNDLLDYNSLFPIGNPPINTISNPELVFLDWAYDVIFSLEGYHNIDSTLYQSYNGNDLRKTVFYAFGVAPDSTAYSFMGSYNGSYFRSSIFTGLATDELYLTRAECSARAGNKDSAMADLNKLMQKRWTNTVPYIPFIATDPNDALTKVLIERRKELVFRGLRWPDIRRLNLEGANITLTKVINGTTYTLLPNNLRSVLLLPLQEITIAGVEQNPR